MSWMQKSKFRGSSSCERLDSKFRSSSGWGTCSI